MHFDCRRLPNKMDIPRAERAGRGLPSSFSPERRLTTLNLSGATPSSRKAVRNVGEIRGAHNSFFFTAPAKRKERGKE